MYDFISRKSWTIWLCILSRYSLPLRYRVCFHVYTLSLFRQISDRDHENICHRLVRLQLQR